jgi:hypothetical protein
MPTFDTPMDGTLVSLPFHFIYFYCFSSEHAFLVACSGAPGGTARQQAPERWNYQPSAGLWPASAVSRSWLAPTDSRIMTSISHHQDHDQHQPSAGSWPASAVIWIMTSISRHQDHDQHQLSAGLWLASAVSRIMTSISCQQDHDQHQLSAGSWPASAVSRIMTSISRQQDHDQHQPSAGSWTILYGMLSEDSMRRCSTEYQPKIFYSSHVWVTVSLNELSFLDKKFEKFN